MKMKILNLGDWQPDNAEWMAQRKDEWRNIKRNLDNMPLRIKKRDQKHHKNFFLYGKFDASLDESGGEAFAYALPLFEVWYAPKINDTFIQDIYNKQMFPHPFTESRGLLFEIGIGPFLPPYGMMGGREEQVIKMLYPGLDWQEKMYFSDEDSEGMMFSEHPIGLVTSCLNLTSGLLMNSSPNPYAPGQYLWEHLNYVFEHYSELLVEINFFQIAKIFRFVLDFNEREDAPKDIVTSVAFRDNLFSRLESGGFCPQLQEIWADVKQQYEAGEPLPVWRNV